MTKTKQDNNMSDYIDLVYTETETKLPWPIWLGAVCEKNRIGWWRD